MDAAHFSERFESYRSTLLVYVTRLVLRSAVAEELVQETAFRAFEARDSAPTNADEFRAWLYRIATNLGLDYLRRHGTVRETVMLDLRRRAEESPAFAEATRTFRGSPEAISVAREHLSFCMACCLQRFPLPQGAALLLVEMVGLTVAQTAAVLDARPAQVKGWLQATRAATDEQYGSTCALVAKQGVCYQCVELDRFHGADRGDPLEGTRRGFADRLEVLRTQPPAQWTQLLGELLDDLG